MKRFIGAAIAAAFFFAPLVAHAAPVNEHAKTAAALSAVEDHWSVAALTGDTAYLETLLAADYRSVHTDGRVTDKAGILKNARKFAKDPSMLRMYRKTAALYESDYQIRGTTGIVIHYLAAKGLAHGIMSVDVFAYDAHDGWRALYSQHTAVH